MTTKNTKYTFVIYNGKVVYDVLKKNKKVNQFIKKLVEEVNESYRVSNAESWKIPAKHDRTSVENMTSEILAGHIMLAYP